MSAGGGTKPVRSVLRALSILRCFTPEQPLLSVAEIGRQLRLSRPTLYRLLATLQQAGFVLAEGEPLRFRLGPAVAPMTQAWSASLNLPALASPVLERLHRQVGETVGLYVPRGDQRVCVAEMPGPQALTVVRGVGSVAPLSRGASGRVILAHRPEGEDDKELARVRRQGFALSRGELMPGVVAIAAAFFDQAGQVAGSVAVFAPESRFDARRERDAARQVVEASGRISELLGKPRAA